MKYSLISSLLLLQTVLPHECSITLKPMWQNLEPNPEKIEQFGKWLLVGSLTFKKRTETKVRMRELRLKWHGPFLEHLTASLYKENHEKHFIPLQENVICDGQWNKKEQTLFLRFEHEEQLCAVNTFYLVLTVPQNIEKHLEHGAFTIPQASLPDPFKKAVKRNESLVLAAH